MAFYRVRKSSKKVEGVSIKPAAPWAANTYFDVFEIAGAVPADIVNHVCPDGLSTRLATQAEQDAFATAEAADEMADCKAKAKAILDGGGGVIGCLIRGIVEEMVGNPSVNVDSIKDAIDTGSG